MENIDNIKNRIEELTKARKALVNEVPLYPVGSTDRRAKVAAITKLDKEIQELKILSTEFSEEAKKKLSKKTRDNKSKGKIVSDFTPYTEDEKKQNFLPFSKEYNQSTSPEDRNPSYAKALAKLEEQKKKEQSCTSTTKSEMEQVYRKNYASYKKLLVQVENLKRKAGNTTYDESRKIQVEISKVERKIHKLKGSIPEQRFLAYEKKTSPTKTIECKPLQIDQTQENYKEAEKKGWWAYIIIAVIVLLSLIMAIVLTNSTKSGDNVRKSSPRVESNEPFGYPNTSLQNNEGSFEDSDIESDNYEYNDNDYDDSSEESSFEDTYDDSDNDE